MAKQFNAEIWAFVMGRDVPVCTIKGNREGLVSEIVAMSPFKDSTEIAKALDRSVWAEGVEWTGGHTLGIRIQGMELQEA